MRMTLQKFIEPAKAAADLGEVTSAEKVKEDWIKDYNA